MQLFPLQIHGEQQNGYRVFDLKRDVLTWLCDFDFELLACWLSSVWSWVVKIYAWSTIWNFFDLRQPQQSQIRSVKTQTCFCSFFVQILIDFLLILSLYDCMTACLLNSTFFFYFCSLFISFCYTYEKNWWKTQKFIFEKCKKTCIIQRELKLFLFSLYNHSETKLVLSQLSFPAYFES